MRNVSDKRCRETKYFVQSLFLCVWAAIAQSAQRLATDLDGPGIESRWGRDFPHLSRPALEPTQPPVQWVPVLLWGKERPERDAEPSSPSSAVVMKG